MDTNLDFGVGLPGRDVSLVSVHEGDFVRTIGVGGGQPHRPALRDAGMQNRGGLPSLRADDLFAGNGRSRSSGTGVLHEPGQIGNHCLALEFPDKKMVLLLLLRLRTGCLPGLQTVQAATLSEEPGEVWGLENRNRVPSMQ